MKISRMLGVPAAAIALAIGFASQASAAGPTHGFFTGDPFGKITGYSGGGTFVENGDKISICDTSADGYAVRLHVYKGGLYKTPAYTLRAGGKGTCLGKTAADGGNYNLPENTLIGLLFCREKGGVESECGGYEWVNDN
ncbi:hypothetical protein AB0467_32290 [Streptomyces sp. NPDC052095]|uniref:hypothetical protein n=1 Tax=unclassified Streptomyces TaxID=2593676 RepID=UPI00344B6E6D